MIELKINSYTDREKLIVALAISGYTVKVEKRERNDPDSFYPINDFYVIIESKVHENEKEELKLKLPSSDIIKHATDIYHSKGRCPNEGHPCYCTGACMGMDNTGVFPYVDSTKFVSK